MSGPVIKLENISKRYLIYHEMQAAYSTLIETISSQAKYAVDFVKSSLLRTPNTNARRIPEEFWALNDINFTINQGECVGIIGKNGAGKSTLLKIMSRIVTPTSGQMMIRGRLASLLEVGTGFHQELSGRENIFLNGSLLGMSRKDILRRFDEIVAFSGVEKFLDTPVKRYSSGMYTRLGFSIAAHLDPDILIVDEVLAVGDFAFQEKCLKKLDRLGSEGKTIIFVSHDVNSVVKLCSRAIYLQDGKVEMIGKAEECALAYMNTHTHSKTEWHGKSDCHGLTIWKAAFVNIAQGQEFYTQGDVAEIGIEYSVDKADPNYYMILEILDVRGHLIASSRSIDFPENTLSGDRAKLGYSLDTALLYPGEYMIKIKPAKVNHSTNSEQVNLRLIVYSRKNSLTINDPILGIKLCNAWNIKN